MTAGVHQVLAGAAPRDAITTHALFARDAIRSMGLRSEIFCDAPHLAGELTQRVRPHTAWERFAREGDHAILHYSIDSAAFEYVYERAARSAIHYHNVTPPDLLWRDAPALALQCARGRDRLASFTGRVSAAAADSVFNADELAQVGMPDATVIGVMRDIPSRFGEPQAAGEHAQATFLFSPATDERLTSSQRTLTLPTHLPGQNAWRDAKKKNPQRHKHKH